MFLPTPDGYPVGSTTFVSPITPPVTAGSAKIKRNGQLLLDEVCWTAYYPCDISSSKLKKGLPWLSRPLGVDHRGYAIFIGKFRLCMPSILDFMDYYVAPRLSLRPVPTYVNAPLLKPNAEVNQWPLVIFSHGLGGSRTAYSQVCTRLAASGKVVLAIEHRDGSAHASVSRSWDAKKAKRIILYVSERDATWENDITHPDLETPPPLPLRTDQLVIRRHEIYHIFDTFSRFIRCEQGVQLKCVNGEELPLSSWTEGSIPPVQLDTIQLAGHSFGGCTLFSILSTHPPDPYKPLPVTHVLILDPWMDPFPSPGPVPITISQKDDDTQSTINNKISSGDTNGNGIIHDGTNEIPRMLVINSEGFTLWTDHFARLEFAVKAFGAKLITLGKSFKSLRIAAFLPHYFHCSVRCSHPSFSDFPLLPFIKTKSSVELMEMIAELSIKFLDNQLDTDSNIKSTLEQCTKDSDTTIRILDNIPDKIVIGKWGDGSNKHKMVGNLGDVIIHS
ncbi:hypothetical protein K435DRAFT_847243 [Dendrothele bispora CBS 962.96]|uniref:1-alkyl-2-acetylglycerophosphocholine esterase n=1 Tax=Dendrothele bispora (strain CBS 962.96) TaxID=1314807 RepID=A0A4S8MYK4_DENBC|nr:hypothetical protein K435DRAFT_847243 [Dendrothele bispora CBS 962.96]